MGIAVNLREIGRLRESEGNLEEAWEIYDECLALLREAGDIQGQSVALHDMGRLRAREGQLVEAWELFEGSLEIGRAHV